MNGKEFVLTQGQVHLSTFAIFGTCLMFGKEFVLAQGELYLSTFLIFGTCIYVC